MTLITDDMLTDWYPGRSKPVRQGVYMRRDIYGNSFAYWDGACWMCTRMNWRDASLERTPSFSQALPWRGLKQPAT